MTNILAYYDTELILILKKVLVQAPGLNTPDVDKLGFCTIKHSTEVIIAVS